MTMLRRLGRWIMAEWRASRAEDARRRMTNADDDDLLWDPRVW